MKKSLSVIFLTLFSILFFIGCEVGLGKSPDLEAPVITITSMESGGTVIKGTEFGSAIYCKKETTFKGLATDNEGVKSVYVEIKWDGENEYTYLSEASLSGENWVSDLAFETEGVASLKFTVTDHENNYSTKSTQVVTLFIDDTAPVGNTWYIDRKVSGIQYSLRDIDYLKSLNIQDSENKDAFQNVAFSIRGSFSDTMGIKNVYIELFDEAGNRLCRIDKTESSGLYAPEFLVTAANLAGLSESERNYIQVKYSAEDVVTVPESNKVERQEISSGWFIWRPDSDKPSIVPSTSPSADDSIHINIKSTLSLSIFDDDCLDSAYCALLTNAEYTALGTNWASNPSSIASATTDNNRKGAFTSNSDNTTREVVNALKAPDSPDTTMHLVAYAKDISYALDGSLNTSKVTTLDIPVQVTDASKPKLFITSPTNNSIPAMSITTGNSSANVTITGQTLDTTGCSYLEFVWVPKDVENKYDTATAFLDTLTTTTAHNALKGSGSGANKTTQNGMLVWSVPLTSAGTEGSFIKQTFSFTVDLFNEFIKPGTTVNEAKEDKYFVVKLTRTDFTRSDNYIYYVYTLKKDDTPPVIHVVSPSGDMQTISNEHAFTLQFNASKPSGLPIKTTEYKIEKVEGTSYIPVTGSYNSASGYYEAPISTSDLSTMAANGEKPKYRFTAKDYFDKPNYAQYTLIVSSLPAIQSVSSTSPTTVKKGDSVDIAVAFSKSVNLVDDEKNTTDENNNTVPHLWLKIKGITNSTSSPAKTSTGAVYAAFSEGDGSTTLHFKYKVEAGDYTSGTDVLKLLNANSISFVTKNNSDQYVDSSSFVSTRVILGTFTNDFDKRGITVDGISPEIAANGITVTSEGTDDGNEHSGVTYLREGKILKVTVITTEPVTVTGSPKFVLSNGGGNIELPYAGQTDSTNSSTITFSKRIASGDINGNLNYSPASCISGYEYIVDSYGNPLLLKTGNPVITTYYIDTEAPAAPAIMDGSGTVAVTAGNKQGSLSFKVVTANSDATVKSSEYSTDGGNSWVSYIKNSEITKAPSAMEQTLSLQLTARSQDYAGNISPNATTLNININKGFPAYNLECTTPDGYYSAGSIIKFKLSFNEKVKIKTGGSSDNIKINLSGAASGDRVSPGAVVELKTTNANSDGWLTTANFEYKVKKNDQFTLKVAAGNTGLQISDLEDEYGFTGSGLTTAKQTGVVCDGEIPYIKSMTPSGETEAESNIYTNGKVITLEFNEPVEKGTGNITLRLVKKWAIPPVLKGTDFNTVLNAIPSAWKVTTTVNSTDKNLTGKQILCMDEAEDVQDLRSGIHHYNDYYHGTGQYIGPYKKSSYGIKTDGSPDTELKYVLDVNMGIWETTTAHYYASTYAAAGNSATPVTLTAANSTKITADNIRNTLEAAGYHERVLDVTSEDVSPSADKKTYTITIPAALTGEADLQNGREWELVIEKGAFVDYTGKEFGSKYTSDTATVYTTEKTATDSIMQNGGTLTDTLDDWSTAGRGRTSVTGTDKPVVLVQTSNSKNSFWSDKVATPVIRIDRYSYGFGIIQSDGSGAQTSAITGDNVVPTGYVRVRIDCETDGAVIKYGKSMTSNSRDDTANTDDGYTSAAAPKELESSNTHCYSYITSTTAPTNLETMTLGNTYTINTFFAAGNGDYTKSCKDYIVAEGTKTLDEHSFEASVRGKECAFQTVVRFYKPRNDNGASATRGNATDGQRAFSIRGTTYWGGEPVIVPYPLRDSRPGSCYLRRCYNERTNDTANPKTSEDYYWVSYEVLVESSFSGYSWHKDGYYDWCNNWGYMHPGEFTICVNMKNWG